MMDMSITMPRKAAKFWWNLKRENKISIPPDVAYYTKKTPYDDWKATTWRDVFAVRKEKQQSNILFKRKWKSHELKACYIWVFYNKGWLMGGWWIYIKTLKRDYGINFEKNNDLVLKAMQMFPCGIIPLLENFDQWAENFAKIYHKEAFGRKKQGLKKCVCKINGYGELEDIAFDFKDFKNE